MISVGAFPGFMYLQMQKKLQVAREYSFWVGPVLFAAWAYSIRAISWYCNLKYMDVMKLTVAIATSYCVKASTFVCHSILLTLDTVLVSEVIWIQSIWQWHLLRSDKMVWICTP